MASKRRPPRAGKPPAPAVEKPATETRIPAGLLAQEQFWDRLARRNRTMAAQREQKIARANEIMRTLAEAHGDMPDKPKPWPGSADTWLCGHGDWAGAFTVYPPQPGEPIWALRRPDDYCRQLVRLAHEVELRIKASYIHRLYYSRRRAT
jgi:hypothetical protein